MFYIKDKKIYTSDWHLNHKNIWIYEYEKRKKFLPSKFKSKEELKEYLNSVDLQTLKQFLEKVDTNLLKTIYKELKKILEREEITTYIDLGDIFFEPNPHKIEVYKTKQSKAFKALKNIFQLLKKYNVKTILYLGNHDSNKVLNFYNLFFDSIVNKTLVGDTYINHKPYTYHFDPEVKYNKINEVKKSIHGHTHSNIAYESKLEEYKNIEYINVSLDYYL